MKYNIIKPIVLGFLTNNDSEEYILDAGTLEILNGDIVFTGVSGKSHISHTQNHAIEVFLSKGLIDPIL
jgi:hypothetical protein